MIDRTHTIKVCGTVISWILGLLLFVHLKTNNSIYIFVLLLVIFTDSNVPPETIGNLLLKHNLREISFGGLIFTGFYLLGAAIEFSLRATYFLIVTLITLGNMGLVNAINFRVLTSGQRPMNLQQTVKVMNCMKLYPTKERQGSSLIPIFLTTLGGTIFLSSSFSSVVNSVCNILYHNPSLFRYRLTNLRIASAWSLL